MTEIEWRNDQVVTLVNEYKNRRVLWDPNHDLYRVQTAKYEAWCELADIFDCEIPDLRKKFNSIFASHRREKSKVRLGCRSTWFLYNHLSFLPNHIERDEGGDNIAVENNKLCNYTITLVNEYKNRRVLWDPNHDLYRVQTATHEAWCELADIFDCEIPDLRKKFNSIFASHRREKSKVRLGCRSTWFLYNHLSFLPNHIERDELGDNIAVVKKRKKKEIVEEPEMEESADEYEVNGDESPVHIVIKEEPENIERTRPKMKYVCSKPRLTRVLKRKTAKDTTLADRNKFLERKLYKRSELFKKKDECDRFGEYIATSLRKHDERTRSMIKQAINNILFEQEMKKCNNSAQYAVLISNMDENPLIIGDECEK